MTLKELFPKELLSGEHVESVYVVTYDDHRTLVFDHIKAPKPHVYVFKRLKSCNQV